MSGAGIEAVGGGSTGVWGEAVAGAGAVGAEVAGVAMAAEGVADGRRDEAD